MHFQPLKAVALVILLWLTYVLYLNYSQEDHQYVRFRLDSSSLPYQYSPAVAAVFESQIIPQPAYLPAAHSSSFTMLPNGDLLAFWFAGTKEGSPDVKIWRSTYHNGKWSMATALVDPQMIAKANHRYVIKVGNPVIYRAENGVLHLFVVSVSIGGWSGSALNHLTSTDGGIHWSEPERIVISPFFNISTLVRTSAVTLSDGGFYLPVYMELGRKYPELLRFNYDGKFVEQIRITAKDKMIQPSLVALSSEKAWVYFRNANKPSEVRNLYASFSSNAGLSWSAPQKTNLLNPDSSLVVANLGSGRLLMVYNQDDRSQLKLALSRDGINWQPFYDLENQHGKEFSYPSIQINEDIVDIMYTDDRKVIKHVRLNREWLDRILNNVQY
ncbi:MAG: exo-alpha-sialidase [Burkholderiales bacterium]|nr:exo-alpha-sialidase [Burkholderiales bacterium]